MATAPDAPVIAEFPIVAVIDVESVAKLLGVQLVDNVPEELDDPELGDSVLVNPDEG